MAATPEEKTMITRKVFHDLAIYMIGFGILVGVIFPFFALAMNVPPEFALDPLFIALCVVAGILVGAVNVFLARRVVARRIRILSKSMRHVESMISLRTTTSKGEICDVDSCSVPVLSDDDLGDTARAFNALIQSLSDSYQAEADLQSFNSQIASQLDLTSISSFALDTLVRRSRAAGGALIVERNGELDIVASRSLLTPERLSDNPVLWSVLKTGRSERIAFPVDVDVDGVISTFRPRELLVIPILYKQVPLGMILLAGSMQFPHNALSGIEAFTAGLSLALKNALTHVQLQELAATDPLTNIYNRRFGLLRLQEEYNRAIRLASPVGVMMCDIDHFKAVNDTYGHVVGDKVLLSVAKAVKAALREGDLAVRYGGEEFVAILPGASLSDTRLVAERIRRSIEDAVVKFMEHEIKVTISIGVASVPETLSDTAAELIEAADKAMYRAKENGRNRIE